MTSTKKFISDLNKVEKFNGDNFDTWHCKIQICTSRTRGSRRINMTVAQPKEGNATQYRQDLQAYEDGKRRIVPLASRC